MRVRYLLSLTNPKTMIYWEVSSSESCCFVIVEFVGYNFKHHLCDEWLMIFAGSIYNSCHFVVMLPEHFGGFAITISRRPNHWSSPKLSVESKWCGALRQHCKTCQNLSELVKICKDLSKFVKTCQKLAKLGENVETCQNLSRFVEICWNLLKFIKTC